MKAQGILDHLRTELDKLMDMGDTVRPEDVIEATGRLVGHGIGATQLASIMSDMPAMGGEGLASWVRMHDVTITNAEMQLNQEVRMLQSRLGVAGLKSLSATALEHHMDAFAGKVPSPGSMAPPSSMAPSGSIAPQVDLTGEGSPSPVNDGGM
jgi:hypothetical protein